MSKEKINVDKNTIKNLRVYVQKNRGKSAFFMLNKSSVKKIGLNGSVLLSLLIEMDTLALKLNKKGFQINMKRIQNDLGFSPYLITQSLVSLSKDNLIDYKTNVGKPSTCVLDYNNIFDLYNLGNIGSKTVACSEEDKEYACSDIYTDADLSSTIDEIDLGYEIDEGVIKNFEGSEKILRGTSEEFLGVDKSFDSHETEEDVKNNSKTKHSSGSKKHGVDQSNNSTTPIKSFDNHPSKILNTPIKNFETSDQKFSSLSDQKSETESVDSDIEISDLQDPKKPEKKTGKEIIKNIYINHVISPNNFDSEDDGWEDEDEEESYTLTEDTVPEVIKAKSSNSLQKESDAPVGQTKEKPSIKAIYASWRQELPERLKFETRKEDLNRLFYTMKKYKYTGEEVTKNFKDTLQKLYVTKKTPEWAIEKTTQDIEDCLLILEPEIKMISTSKLDKKLKIKKHNKQIDDLIEDMDWVLDRWDEEKMEKAKQETQANYLRYLQEQAEGKSVMEEVEEYVKERNSDGC